MKLETVSAMKARIILAATTSMILVGGAMADINWTEISSILDGVATNLFPSLVTLITAAVPIIIIVSIVGFITMFLDRILGMLK